MRAPTRLLLLSFLSILLLLPGCFRGSDGDGGGSDGGSDGGGSDGDGGGSGSDGGGSDGGGDLCAGVTCTPPADACRGNTRVSHSGNGSCDPADGSCDFSAVEVITDCSRNGGSCDTATATCVGADPCFGTTCEQPASRCDQNVALSYSGAGVCDPLLGTCDFGAVETRTDCTPRGETCTSGVCIATVPEPAPGELLITEVMQNPAAVADSAGEWFELLSLASSDRDLEGLTLDDAPGTNVFVIATGAPVILPAGQRLVFGRNADPATNGGVAVDVLTSGFNLGNGTDTIRILARDGTTVIDAITWDNGATFPDPNGASMQYGSDQKQTPIDNDLGAGWCPSRDPYGAGDFGTPGGPNTPCNIGPIVVSAYDLNDVNAMNHPQVNVPVQVPGVVVTANVGGHLWVEDPAGGAFSGLYVDIGIVDVSAAVRGSVVDLEGTYSESFGLTRIILSAITVVGPGTLPPAEPLPTSTFADPLTAEPWENVLVRVVEVGVTQDALGNGEVRVDANLIVDDLLYLSPSPLRNCDLIDSLEGPLNYSFGNFKIEPRDAADVGTITSNTVAATAPATVTIMNFAFDLATTCVLPGTDITWSNQDAISHSVIERDPLLTRPANIPVAPAFDSGLIAPAASWTFTAPASGTHPYRCEPHPNMEGRVIVLE